MGHGIVKCIVYAVTMGILYIVMESMNNRNSGGKGASHNDSHYIVRVPSALKYVYMIMFFMGILLFFVFAIVVAFVFGKLYYKWTENAAPQRRYGIMALAFCLLFAFASEYFFGVADITGAYVAGLAI